MNDRVKMWLSTVASQLDLPAEQKAAVLDELQAHVQADLADRLRQGLSEDEAISATLAEMGDPKPVAVELNRVHSNETSLVRTLLGVQIMFLGFIGSIVATGAMEAWTRIGDQPMGPLGAGWWHRALLSFLRWIVEHDLHQRAVLPLLLAGVSLIVGYVARRSAWKCAFLPIVGIYGLLMLVALSTGGQVRLDMASTASLGATVAALLGGAHLGAKLARSTRSYRRVLFGVVAGIASLIPSLGLIGGSVSVISAQVGARCPSILGVLILASIIVPGLLVLFALARRRWRRAVTQE
jgi:hypothetical protein